MGQYYTLVNMDKKERLYSHSFGSGLKLMESCYVRNEYMEAIAHLLAGPWKGDRVLYCGDYAWDDPSGSAGERLRELAQQDPYEFAEQCEDISTQFAACEGNTRLESFKTASGGHGFRSVPLEGSFEIRPEHYRYLANETKGVFVDREVAPVAWVWVEGENFGITRTDPLPLFMAIGNGLGGGDYWGENQEKIGSWAGDVIVPTNERPGEGYQEIASPFDENGVFLTMGDAELSEIIRANMDKVAARGGMDAKELVERFELNSAARTESLQDLAQAAKDRAEAKNMEHPKEAMARSDDLSL